MGLLLDVFNDDAFGFFDLTDTISTTPYKPGQITQFLNFETESVTQRLIGIEEQSNTLQLIASKIPGQDPSRLDAPRRTLRSFEIPHFPVAARIYARELAGVRAFGEESSYEQLEAKRAKAERKIGGIFDVLEEYHKLGAVKGIIYDSDGSTELINLFDEFGVTKPTTQFFNLAAATENQLWDNIDNIHLNMEAALPDTPTEDTIWAACGTTFFQLLVRHAAVKDAYRDWAATAQLQALQSMNTSGQAGDFLRSSMLNKVFPYRNINWFRYRGSVGGVQFVADTACHFFANGVDGLFTSRYAPSEQYMETVNTPGRPRYVFPFIDERERWIDLEAEMNDFHICTQPLTLLEGSSAAS